MHRCPASPRAGSRPGFSLVEFLIALTVVAYGLLGLIALQGQTLRARASPAPAQSAAAAPAPRIAEAAGGPECGTVGTSTRRDLECWTDLVTRMRPQPRPALARHGIDGERHRLQVDGAARDVLVFGGAVYGDGGERAGIYIVDAHDGRTLWAALPGPGPAFDAAHAVLRHPGLRDPVAERVAALDTDRDGVLDRLYAADAGGMLWRVDLGAEADHDANPHTPRRFVGDRPSLWTVAPLASLGRHAAGGEPRRFFTRAEVVRSRDRLGPFEAVLIGSGDAERPDADRVEDWFYLIKDRAVASGQPPARALEQHDLADLSDNCLQVGRCAYAPDLRNGWRIGLSRPGEKVLDTAVAAAETVFFTTYTPPAHAGGQGRDLLYSVALQDATVPFDAQAQAPAGPGDLRVVKVLSGEDGAAPGAGPPVLVAAAPRWREIEPWASAARWDDWLRRHPVPPWGSPFAAYPPPAWPRVRLAQPFVPFPGAVPWVW